MKQDRNQIPIQLWVGLGLIAVFWPVNWLTPGEWTHVGFFPLWLGYCLTVDGVVFIRKGESLLSRDHRKYLGLFLLSIPMWWLFEALNLRLENWHYLGRESMSNLEYGILASLSFSTVIPAVLESAELMGSFPIWGWLEDGPVLDPRRSTEIITFVGGWAGLVLLLIWPQYFFPLVWLSVYFILDPINRWLGHRSLLSWTAKGNWQPFGALFAGVLMTGFFWEMWNYYSYPKWIYSVPFVNGLKIFEMPLLGYGGYLPFSLEIYAVTLLAFNLFGLEPGGYLKVVGEGDDLSGTAPGS